jgi:hypothetical protein
VTTALSVSSTCFFCFVFCFCFFWEGGEFLPLGQLKKLNSLQLIQRIFVKKKHQRKCNFEIAIFTKIGSKQNKA